MAERYLIGRTQRGQTKSGKDVAELYSTDTRLEYPVLVLFDLSMLTTVGIDPNELTAEPVHLRYWAHYEESEKKTSKGNPYLDVVFLEPIDAPASTTSTDTSAIVAELRGIRADLVALHDLVARAWSPAQPEPAADSYIGTVDADPAADEYPHIAKVLHKRETNGEAPPENGDRLRFYDLAAQAQADGWPTQEQIDKMVGDVAATEGWLLAAECLAAEAARKPGRDYDHRHAIIARIEELLEDPTVQAADHGLVTGWQWTVTKAELLRAGKGIKAAMETE